MSGFEIAGVVLGAFPVAIKALEKYREIGKLWGFWWEIRAQYTKCFNEVKYHRLSFSRNLKQLLLPMAADKTQIQRLLADPGGDEWREQGIAQQLEDRLQESYELYFELIQQLQRTMEELNKELAVDKEELQKQLANDKSKDPKAQAKGYKPIRQQPLGKASREYELYRLKFSIGESKRKELFEELKEYNERLEKLLTTSDVIAQLENKRENLSRVTKSAVDSAVSHFWRHADRLYKALSCAWNCSCVSQHRAKVILQHKAPTDLEFLLLFLNHSNVSPRPWHLRGTKIKLLDPPSQENLFKTITIMAPGKEKTDPNNKKSPPPTINKIKSKTSTTATFSSNAIVATTSSSSQRTPQSRHNGEIESLCESLRGDPPLKIGFGFLEDDHKRYYIYPLPKDAITFKLEDPVTLSDLLKNKHNPPLNRRQRYTLALTLASAFLQLRESAWLNSASWSKADITFFRDANNPSNLVLDCPYVTRSFSSSSGTQSQQEDGVSSIPSLGVLLLELCFGVLIDKHPSRQRCPPGDEKTAPLFDLVAAVDWLREVGDEAGPDYYGATEWCLLGSRSVTGADAWRRLLFEKVVQPLERCHSYLNPGTASTPIMSIS